MVHFPYSALLEITYVTMADIFSQFLVQNELLVLFSIILVGYLFGTVSIRGISFGPGGIFLVALFFGHHGFSLPKEVMELGLVLFVYTIGIQVGPRFVRMFKKEGGKYASVALLMVLMASVLTYGVARALDIPSDIAVGLFSGAITNTPAMAVATDMAERSGFGDGANVTAGYAISYPFAIVLAILFVQILPRILRRNPRKEEEEWVQREKATNGSLVVRHCIVEHSECCSKSLEEVCRKSTLSFTVSRVRRGERVLATKPSLTLVQGDIITVVGAPADMERVVSLFGTETNATLTVDVVRSDDVEVVSSRFAGKRLRDLHVWQEYGITVTRIERLGLEIVPHGAMYLEEGDTIRVVGERIDVERFVRIVGAQDLGSQETHFAPFLLGLVFGLFLGFIEIPLMHGSSIVLGATGGALIAGLLFSHIRRVGGLELHVPPAAVLIVRELGLMLFLAGAGLVAGSRFMQVYTVYGATLLLVGACITLGTLGAGVLLMRVLGFPMLSVSASLAGGMTQPAVLAVARAQGTTDLPLVVYASVYPFAMIFKIVVVQVLFYVLEVWR
jgi:putative transport protein